MNNILTDKRIVYLADAVLVMCLLHRGPIWLFTAVYVLVLALNICHYVSKRHEYTKKSLILDSTLDISVLTVGFAIRLFLELQALQYSQGTEQLPSADSFEDMINIPFAFVTNNTFAVAGIVFFGTLLLTANPKKRKFSYIGIFLMLILAAIYAVVK